jgi:hypothetical protein
LNSQNLEVTVPFSVFSVEVVGDFSYIVYYNSRIENASYPLVNSITGSFGYFTSEKRSIGITKFETLLKAFGPYTEGMPGMHAFTILHNASGKLFNAVEALTLNFFDDGNMQFTVGLQSLSLFQDKIVYFKNSSPSTNTCKGELVYDELSANLTKTETCTPLDIVPIFTHSNGYFVYLFNNKMTYASPDFTVTGDLTKYFGGSIYQTNVRFKSVGNNVVLITNQFPSVFVVFDENFQVIEEKTDELERGYYLSEASWLFNKDGFDYFNSYSTLFYVNFETFEYGFIDFNEQFPPLPFFSPKYLFIVFEGNLYQIATKIQVLETYNTFVSLERDVFMLQGVFGNNSIDGSNIGFNKILNEGYIEYSQTQGLAQINKSLNLQTGEIFLESESRPTITVTQVQPIN